MVVAVDDTPTGPRATTADGPQHGGGSSGLPLDAHYQVERIDTVMRTRIRQPTSSGRRTAGTRDGVSIDDTSSLAASRKLDHDVEDGRRVAPDRRPAPIARFDVAPHDRERRRRDVVMIEDRDLRPHPFGAR
jgi:hypothetical protein